MRAHVVRVVVLIGHRVLVARRVAVHEGMRQRDGPVFRMVDRAQIVGSGIDLGAEHAQQDLLFIRHTVGDGDGDRVSEQACQCCEGNPRVT